MMFLTGSCFADIITVAYTGQLFSSSVAQISDNATFSGSVTYQDPEPLFGISGGETTWDTSPGDQISLTINGFNFSFVAGAPHTAGVGSLSEADSAGQVFLLLNGGAPSSFTTNLPSSAVDQLTVQFVWPSGTFSPSELPDPFDAADVQLGAQLGLESGITLGLTDGGVVAGLIDSVHVVPEPRMTILLTVALAILYASRLRTRYLKSLRARPVLAH